MQTVERNHNTVLVMLTTVTVTAFVRKTTQFVHYMDVTCVLIAYNQVIKPIFPKLSNELEIIARHTHKSNK